MMVVLWYRPEAARYDLVDLGYLRRRVVGTSDVDAGSAEHVDSSVAARVRQKGQSRAYTGGSRRTRWPTRLGYQ